MFVGSATQKVVKATVFEVMAEELFAKGRFDELRSVTSDRLRDRPNDLYALLYAGKLHLQAKEWNEALGSFEKIQALDPSRAEFVKPYIVRARESGRIGEN